MYSLPPPPSTLALIFAPDSTSVSVDPNKTKVLSTEVNTFKRRIKEAIQIKLTKPALNRDNGYELAAIYDTILTPKRR